jgi:hypothetical protein
MKYISYLTKALIILLIVFFLIGCYATTHRGPATLKPGQFSGNVGYMHLKGTDADTNDNPGKLVTVDARAGVLKFWDLGLTRTFDMTDYEGVDTEGMDTYWVDTKVQLSNLEGTNLLPQLALGYGFGDMVADDDQDDKIFVNSLYVILGIPTGYVTPYYSFRYEFASDEVQWVPSWAWEEESDMIQKAHIIGFEVNAIEFAKPVFEFGRFYVDDFADGLNIITAGLNFYLDVPKLLLTKDTEITE